MPVIAKERLYLTADRKRAVGHADPDGAFLLCGVGQAISDREATRLGIVGGRAPRPNPEPEGTSVAEEKAEDKAEDKEVKKGEDKGAKGVSWPSSSGRREGGLKVKRS